MTYKTLSSAIETFRLGWNVDRRTIGRDFYLLPKDQADQIERYWTILIEKAANKDFVYIDEVLGVDRDVVPFRDIVESGIHKLPSLSWIDQGRQIYWSLDRLNRGWNKTLNACRKIFTVTSAVSFTRLTVAVQRSRTVREFPPDDAFVSMLLATEEFEVDNGVVFRGASFTPLPLSNIDQVMVNATNDCGTVTTFTELREALVRRGLSTNHAQVKMVLTPFWVTTARGKYRFVGNEAQLTETCRNGSLEVSECEAKQGNYVELEINHRHMVSGNHRIEENAVKPGKWLLRDNEGNNHGEIQVTDKMIRGLNAGLASAGIKVGTFVIIDFSREEFVAELIW